MVKRVSLLLFVGPHRSSKVEIMVSMVGPHIGRNGQRVNRVSSEVAKIDIMTWKTASRINGNTQRINRVGTHRSANDKSLPSIVRPILSERVNWVSSSLRLTWPNDGSQCMQTTKVDSKLTTTGGDGAECHGPNFFASVSGTYQNTQVWVEELKYATLAVGWTDFSHCKTISSEYVVILNFLPKGV